MWAEVSESFLIFGGLCPGSLSEVARASYKPCPKGRGGLFLSNLADDHEPRGPVAPVSEGHQILGSIDDVLKLL